MNIQINNCIEQIKRVERVLKECADGTSLMQSCKKHNIDYLKLNTLLKSKTFAQLSFFSEPLMLDEAYYVADPFELLYMAVFDGEHMKMIKLPPDYMYTMNAMMETLTEREQEVLRLTICDGEDLKEVGNDMGVTQERVRQVQAKALKKLRHPSRAKILTMGCAKYERMSKQHEVVEKSMHASLQEDIPLENAGLSCRSYNCLHRKGIKTLNEVVGYSDEDFLKIRNLGRKSIDEIRARILELDLNCT